ncbi:MAG: TadE/TadG family type IV pilus assembly protein [Gammaproteobacteria bacterium]
MKSILRNPTLARQPFDLSRHQRGVTTVELCLVLFSVLVVITGALDGARLIYAYSSVAHASREAVRYASVRGQEASEDSYRSGGDAPATQEKIIAHLSSVSAPTVPLQVTATWPDMQADGSTPSKAAGSLVTVTVASNFDPVVPFLRPIPLSSTSSMVIFY